MAFRTSRLPYRQSRDPRHKTLKQQFRLPRPNYTKEVKNPDGSLKTVTTDKVESLASSRFGAYGA